MSEPANIPTGPSDPSGPRPTEHRASAATNSRQGASPIAAAALAAGIAYMWAEAIFRYAFTHSPSFNNSYFILFKSRPGDVASMWATILIIEVAVFVALAYLWRGRQQVGSLREWTIALIVSAIAAPMLGEIGTPGTGTIGAGTTDAIAWIVTALAVIGGAVALAWPRLRSRPSAGSPRPPRPSATQP